MELHGRLRTVWICLVELLGVAFFCFGFFPGYFRSDQAFMKAKGSWLTLEDIISDAGCVKRLEVDMKGKGAVSKLVLVVIDAWQSRFFFDRPRSMPFLHSLHDDGRATVFNAHLQNPTVTMPRIKAITAGIVPSFADVLFNFASAEFLDENLIALLKDANRRIVFCGDDTWLKLFPGKFENRSEGTVSFYVNDYTEVDDNVTRCMQKELLNSTFPMWDVMILHYLGLDHIGHSLGGAHERIDTKLSEMDSVAQLLYTTMHDLMGGNFSIVVLGDHGMTEAGNHGGASERESNVPLMFIDGRIEPDATPPLSSRSSFFALQSEQVDVSSTMAGLLGVRVPTGSLGVSLLPLITHRSSFDIVRSLLSTAYFARRFRTMATFPDGKLTECVERCEAALRGLCRDSEAARDTHRIVIRTCFHALRNAQRKLIVAQTEVCTPFVLIGTVISVLCTVVAFWWSVVVSQEDGRLPSVELSKSTTAMISLAMLLLNAATFFGSSLIEEEHDVVYFFYTSLLFALLMKSVHELVRSWKGRYLVGRESRIAATGTIVALLCIHRLCRAFTEDFRRRWLLENDYPTDSREWPQRMFNLLTSVGSNFTVGIAEILTRNGMVNVACNIGTSLLVIRTLWRTRRRDASKGSLNDGRVFGIALLVGFLCIFLKQFGSAFMSERGLWSVVMVCCGVLLGVGDAQAGLVLWTAVIFRANLFPLLGCFLISGALLARLDLHPFALIFPLSAAYFLTKTVLAWNQ